MATPGIFDIRKGLEKSISQNKISKQIDFGKKYFTVMSRDISQGKTEAGDTIEGVEVRSEKCLSAYYKVKRSNVANDHLKYISKKFHRDQQRQLEEIDQIKNNFSKHNIKISMNSLKVALTTPYIPLPDLEDIIVPSSGCRLLS